MRPFAERCKLSEFFCVFRLIFFELLFFIECIAQNELLLGVTNAKNVAKTIKIVTLHFIVRFMF